MSVELGERDKPRLLSWEEAVVHARNSPEMAYLVEHCYYDDPIEIAARRFKASEEWPAILSLLPLRPGAKVLEIGAGRGVVSWSFATEGCEVYALEPNPSSIVGAGAIRKLCEATGAHINIVETGGENLAFPDNYFDYVICRAVLHHVSDLSQVCREVFRVLKPGGRFLAIKEHVAETPEELSAFLQSHPLHHLYGGEHAFALDDYLGSLCGSGMCLLNNYGQYDHPVTSYPLISSKAIKEMAQGTLAARLPVGLAGRISESAAVLWLYRRWLTFRCRVPGRVHSFLAEKPA